MSRRTRSSGNLKESDKDFFLRASDYANVVLGRKRKRKKEEQEEKERSAEEEKEETFFLPPRKALPVVSFSLLPSNEFTLGNFHITYICHNENGTHALFVKYVDGGVLLGDIFKDAPRFEYLHQHVTVNYIITKIPLSVNMVGSAETCLQAIVYPYFKYINKSDKIKEWVIINKSRFICFLRFFFKLKITFLLLVRH